MYLLFLNPTLKAGLEAQGVDLCSCMDEESLSRWLSPQDIELIAHQSTGIASMLNMRHGNVDIFQSAIEALTPNPDEQDPYLFKAYGINPMQLLAQAVDKDRVLLYADSAPDETGPRTSVNILCALSLIMPTSDVMELPMFGRIAHHL